MRSPASFGSCCTDTTALIESIDLAQTPGHKACTVAGLATVQSHFGCIWTASEASLVAGLHESPDLLSWQISQHRDRLVISTLTHASQRLQVISQQQEGPLTPLSLTCGGLCTARSLASNRKSGKSSWLSLFLTRLVLW